jgi:hypothetical protein
LDFTVIFSVFVGQLLNFIVELAKLLVQPFVFGTKIGHGFDSRPVIKLNYASTRFLALLNHTLLREVWLIEYFT